MAKAITDENFKALLAGDQPLVVDFWAEWCGPCKMIAPIIDELSNEYEGKVVIGKVDVDADECADLTVEYGIRSIPTILFFKNGELVDRHVGAGAKALFDEKIKALL